MSLSSNFSAFLCSKPKLYYQKSFQIFEINYNYVLLLVEKKKRYPLLTKLCAQEYESEFFQLSIVRKRNVSIAYSLFYSVNTHF